MVIEDLTSSFNHLANSFARKCTSNSTFFQDEVFIAWLTTQQNEIDDSIGLLEKGLPFKEYGRIICGNDKEKKSVSRQRTMFAAICTLSLKVMTSWCVSLRRKLMFSNVYKTRECYFLSTKSNQT